MPTARPNAPRRARLARGLLAAACALALAACQTADLSRGSAGLGIEQPLLGLVEERAPAAFVIDVDSGRILFEENGEALRYPASLTKMMTLYLLFERLEDGSLSLDDELLVSELAASRPPTKIGAPAGSTIRVRDAAQALAVRSANDVAVVVAENLAGSEEAFALLMTAKARELGMRGTRFRNASGLPNPEQVTTARDMAVLARALRLQFPGLMPFFSVPEFSYDGRRFVATNKLLGKVAGVDGMKTGYIRASGFHLAASAQRGNNRIIAVVMGGETGAARDAKATALLERYL